MPDEREEYLKLHGNEEDIELEDRRKQKLVQNAKGRQMQGSFSSQFCSIGIAG
jgi:hypothetical protein